MAENDPVNFQINLILKKLRFKNGQKPKFTIGGNHNKYRKDDKHKILVPDDSMIKTGELKKGTFNKEIQKSNNSQRASLAHNLFEIFEGYSVAYVQGGDISPFIPFSKDSEGGINSLFYNGSDNEGKEGEGDIFIDCGYTKFFFNMTEIGTVRYLQNIGGFIGSCERRQNYMGDIEVNKETFHCLKYRPKGLNFKLDKDPIKHYKYKKIKFDIVYLVDATGSMELSIKNVEDHCVEISNILKQEKALYEFKFGAVFYRDPIDSETDENEYIPLTDDMNKLKNFIKGIKAYGGGDGPEDWVGGYDLALHNMNWEAEYKLIIHITDYGGHGEDYSLNDKHPKEGEKLDELIIESINKNITIAAFQIKDLKTGVKYCQRSFDRVAKWFETYDKKDNFRPPQDFDPNRKDPYYFTSLVVDAVQKIA